MNSTHLLQAVNISKSFPGVRALENVSLHLDEGRVLAITGENGAGKSTLMKILMGMYSPDSGSIFLQGKRVVFQSVQDAIRSGFSMIHQELNAFPALSVAENIFIGKEPTGIIPGWINQKKMNREATVLLSKLGMDLDVTRPMRTLRVAEMQMVEIAKAISNNARVIFMDEPTSAITGREVEILFGIIAELKAQGIAIVYISHKMDEILRISDDVLVMRDGKSVTTRPSAGLRNEQLVSWIVGREVQEIYGRKGQQPGEVILSVEQLSGRKFRSVSFSLRRGEILGMAGLMGAGRTEIVHALYGLEPAISGQVYIHGRERKIKSPRDAIRAGISLVSEDRKLYGLVLSASVRHNISLSSLDKLSGSPFVNLRAENRVVDEQISSLRIKLRSKDERVRFLSGGNQQKVVIARALLNDADIIILDEPTRGIDIHAKTEIYQLIRRLADAGKAIIMISSELPEVLGLSDRILVIHEGRIRAELAGDGATQEMIMKVILEFPQPLINPSS